MRIEERLGDTPNSPQTEERPFHQSLSSPENGEDENNVKSARSVVDFSMRKAQVDQAFDSLRKILRKEKGVVGGTSSSALSTGHHASNLPFSVSSSSLGVQYAARQASRGYSSQNVEPFSHLDQENEEIEGDEDDEPRISRSSDEDGGSDNLDEFSGLEELELSENEDDIRKDTIGFEMKRKKPRQRDYAPNGRKQRGYHKWAGLSVALLSTGETGIVMKNLGGRIKVKLDHDPNLELSSAEEKLHLMYNQHGPAAIEEIYEACKYVPQWKDLKVGQRVAMLRYENATGRVAKLPEEKRALDGLGHVLVALDFGGEQKKAVLETLRLIDEEHPSVAYNEAKQKTLGRPTKAEMARKTSPPLISPIIPFSKRGDAWKRSLRPPSGHISPPQSPAPAAIIPKFSGRGEDEFKRRRKEDSIDEDGPKRVRAGFDNGKPILTRGKKLCRSCNAIIGTACRVCSHCGKPCAKAEKH